MNFNYNKNNFVNYEFKGRQVEQKVKEEEKKQEELKKEESVKPETVAPKQEKVTANALDVMAMQYKGELELVIDKGQGAGEPKSGIWPDVAFEIQEWNNLDENATYQDKLNILWNIINAYEQDLNDPDSARIWRAIRYTLTQNECARQRLEFYQNITGHAISKIPDYSSIPMPDIYNGDAEAYSELYYDMYADLDDKQKLIVTECNIAISTNNALLYLINSTNPNCNAPDTLVNLSNNAGWLFGALLSFVDDPQNSDKPWKNIFNNKYYNLFTSFQNSVYSGAGIGSVSQQVNQLQGVIEELREQGFPYCDELLISIQGYLVSYGYDSINVISPNSHGNHSVFHKIPGSEGAK